MSVSDTLVLATAAVKDPSLAQNTAVSAVQSAATAVTEVVGKGGFTADASIAQLVEFQFTGLLVVFVVLGGLTAMCSLMAWIIKTVAPGQYYGNKTVAEAHIPHTTQTKPVAAHEPVPTGIHPGLTDEEFIAILAVAAADVLGHTVSVVRFRTTGSMDWVWPIQGRASHHSSHQP